ncbi:rod shape-determining protein RodA [Inmirania thermothiophila]|uniref:Peptidoglycan glycosyltransferase MrdB n=1 Tax=Inmirania thermothiophila TaxID=1750597 RepID=A0A3N1YBB2_9GAMM|nr:rod shape-determining protein RodA [Inmirania thermothiophila]ROR34687.1 cell elongation-specific peptidoglycan biosynthesis regulator RodA [Inmirania thermothiophila]
MRGGAAAELLLFLLAGARRLLRIDGALLGLLALVAAYGLLVLYSASGEDLEVVRRQLVRLGVAFAVFLAAAQVPPRHLRAAAPLAYVLTLGLLVAVLAAGEVGKGAQRWLDLGLFRFQPSELMKIALPMMVARFLADRPLPPAPRHVLAALALIALPVALIVRQPDLGTGLLVGASGLAALFLAGLPWRWMLGGALAAAAGAPLAWHFMHEYQRQRVRTFLDPESDPLGAGYHIIQSKIAIGSGGIYGKGWLAGTQSHLEFLPERSTDFIFAVLGEELGLAGELALIGLYLLIAWRGLAIAARAQDAFSRLLAGALVLTFFVYVFVNIGMVSGLLPVVGLPLPLVSFGGTSMVTLMAGFGILSAVQSHRRLLAP